MKTSLDDLYAMGNLVLSEKDTRASRVAIHHGRLLGSAACPGTWLAKSKHLIEEATLPSSVLLFCLLYLQQWLQFHGLVTTGTTGRMWLLEEPLDWWLLRFATCNFSHYRMLH